jgi:hypothetical protein
VRSSIRGGAGLLLFGAAMAAAGGCTVRLDSQSQITREERRFPVKGTPALHATTFDGSINNQSGDEDDVQEVLVPRGATREAVDALVVTASQKGDTIDLEVAKPRESSFRAGFGMSGSARLTLWVPRSANVRARSGDGSIQIGKVRGRIDLHTGDGSIRANDIAGELTLSTGDGSVTVEGAEGRLTLDTGDGGVNVAGNLGSLRLHTGDGSIVYRAGPGTTLSDDWEITTGDGGVSLYLPEDFGAELDAHTGDGSIRNDLDVARAGTSEISRRTVRGRLGGGGRQLRIRTGDGAIRLRTF